MPVADPRIFRRRPPGNGALEWSFRHFPDGDVPGPISPPAANRPSFQSLERLSGVIPRGIGSGGRIAEATNRSLAPLVPPGAGAADCEVRAQRRNAAAWMWDLREGPGGSG